MSAPRIIGGKHRGRPLLVPEGHEVRPTASRAREGLFNILLHAGWRDDGGSPLAGGRVLDAFAGAGGLGIEALSRGAAHATFMDTAPEAVRIIGANLRSTDETANARVLRADATRPPAAMDGGACSVVMLDPPYRSALGGPALTALAAAGWMAAGAVCSLEVAYNEDVEAPAGFAALDERRYGKAKFLFFRYGSAD